jgi:quercetin dioxygenase-like cupin family protein
LICLEAGQEIPAHPSGTGIFYVLEGKGIMYLDDEEISVSKGTVVVAPEGSKRGIKGVERLVAVAVHVS